MRNPVKLIAIPTETPNPKLTLYKTTHDQKGERINNSPFETTDNETYISHCLLCNSGRTSTNSLRKTQFFDVFVCSADFVDGNMWSEYQVGTFFIDKLKSDVLELRFEEVGYDPCGFIVLAATKEQLGLPTLNKSDLEAFAINPVEDWVAEYRNRCCGRCDGVDDICSADMICDKHKGMGCEICYGKRGWNVKTYPDNTVEIYPTNDLEYVGEQIAEYSKKYLNTNKYNDVMLAIEFGYQLALRTEK